MTSRKAKIFSLSTQWVPASIDTIIGKKEILIKRQKVLTYYINNEFEQKYVIEFVLRIIEIPM